MNEPEEQKIPEISKELIDYLKLAYPNECPSRHTSDREVWIKVGQVEVVQNLISIHNQQSSKGES